MFLLSCKVKEVLWSPFNYPKTSGKTGGGEASFTSLLASRISTEKMRLFLMFSFLQRNGVGQGIDSNQGCRRRSVCTLISCGLLVMAL